MCWDGTRGVAPCFGVAIFSRISQAFSEESSAWELPTVLSLADSYFHNSSFLWGDMKHGSRWTYSELPATVKIPGFQWATLFAKWYGQEDYRAAHLLKTRQEHNRGSLSMLYSAPRTVAWPLPHCPQVSSTGLSSLSLHPSQLTFHHSPRQVFHTAPHVCSLAGPTPGRLQLCGGDLCLVPEGECFPYKWHQGFRSYRCILNWRKNGLSVAVLIAFQ